MRMLALEVPNKDLSTELASLIRKGVVPAAVDTVVDQLAHAVICFFPHDKGVEIDSRPATLAEVESSNGNTSPRVSLIDTLALIPLRLDRIEEDKVIATRNGSEFILWQ